MFLPSLRNTPWSSELPFCCVVFPKTRGLNFVASHRANEEQTFWLQEGNVIWLRRVPYGLSQAQSYMSWLYYHVHLILISTRPNPINTAYLRNVSPSSPKYVPWFLLIGFVQSNNEQHGCCWLELQTNHYPSPKSGSLWMDRNSMDLHG